MHESLQDMLNRHVVLIPLARLAHGVLKDALAAFTKLVFVCP
jgi:hypothetical protein